MIRIFCKTTRWEIPLSHSTLGREVESGKGSLRSSSPGKRKKLANWILRRETRMGRQPVSRISPRLSRSSFSRTMRQNRRSTEGRQACRNKEGCQTLLHDLRETRPVAQRTATGTVHCRGCQKYPPFCWHDGKEEGAQRCLWRRAYDYQCDRLFMTRSENYNPTPAFTVLAINLFCYNQARSSYVVSALLFSFFSREPALALRSILK